MSKIPIEICRFKKDAAFAFSMTYDEGTVDCLANAFAIHEKFGIPGHVDVVTGQLGQKRDCFLSSLNNYYHMDAKQLQFLIEHGWGVGNHSFSHYCYPASPGLNLYREIVWSKYTLEDALGSPVRIFTICNDMYNYEATVDMVKQHYMGCVSVENAPNRDGYDFFNIGNCMMSSQPFRPRSGWPQALQLDHLNLDFIKDSWVLLTSHLVMWDVPQAHKCITPEYLTRYFEKLMQLNDGDFWAVTPDDAIDYEYLRRGLRVEDAVINERSVRFTINGTWPIGIVNSMLTFKINGLSIGDKNPKIQQTFAVTHGGYTGHDRIECIENKGLDTLLTMQAVPGKTVTITW